MTTQLTALVTAVIVAAISGLVTWKVAKRSASGAIDTSEASTLWDEGTTMRQELRVEVVGLRAQLAEAISAVTALNREITHSRQETEAAREETRKSRAETRLLMAQIESLHAETKGVLEEVKTNTEETKNVLEEVKTSNALSIGALADNTESRRILDIPAGKRTVQENEHLASAHTRIPDAFRASQGEDDE